MADDENQQPSINKLSRWQGLPKTTYAIIAISTIGILVAGYFLNKKLKLTEIELESCRSTCSSAS